MDNFQIAMTLDLKQFYASLESIEGVSQETVKELQAMFGKVQSVQIPFDGKKIQAELDKVSKGVTPVSSGMNRAAQSTQALNYIMRDSPYFFQNFNMGMMAIGNNLNPFIDQMLRAKQETGSWKGALGTLTSGLTGLGGVSFAFSTIVTAITAYSLATSGAKEKTKDLKKEVDELKASLERASFDTLKRKEIETRIELLDAENKLLKEQNEEKIKREAAQKNYRPLDKSLLGSEETKQEVEAAKEKLKLITEYQSKLGLVGEQENKIAELREKRRGLRSDAEITAIDKEIEALENKYKKQKEKKEKDILVTDAEIRAEIKKLNVLLSGNISTAERLRLEEMKITKVKELIVVTEDLIKSYEKLGRVDTESTGKDIKKSLKGPFKIEPLEKIARPEIFKETNSELERTLLLSDALTNSFNNAADAVAGAMAASLTPFKQANSLLQIFINQLIAAIIQALTLKLILSGIGFFGGLLGFNSGGYFSTKGFASGGLFSGAPGIDKNLVRLSDGEFVVNANSTKQWFPVLNAINNTPAYASGGYHNGSSIIGTPLIQTIILDTRVKGRDVYFTQRKEESYRRRYYGASS